MHQWIYDWGYLVIIITSVINLISAIANYVGYRFHKRAEKEYHDAYAEIHNH